MVAAKTPHGPDLRGGPERAVASGGHKEETMLTHLRPAGAFFSVALACLVSFADGARGQTFNQGNGHYYEFVAASGISWQAASAAAAGRVYGGVHGHLATIDSTWENILLNQLTGQFGFVGAWIGAASTANNEWTWSVGPESGTVFWQGGVPVAGAFVNWNPGEPNNAPGFAYMGIGNVGAGRWFDDDDGIPGSSDPVIGYFVEYELEPAPPIQLGNNFYQFVWRPHVSWGGAAEAAFDMTFQGMGGHLLTPNSVAENAVAAIAAANSGIDRSSIMGAWIAIQVDSNSRCTWAAGPEVGAALSQYQTPINGAYVNWGGAEPDSLGGACWMSIGASSGSGAFGLGRWRDDSDGYAGASDPVVGFLVEYEPVACASQIQLIAGMSSDPSIGTNSCYVGEVLPAPSGELFVSYKVFPFGGGLSAAARVARWTGMAWSSLPGAFSLASVLDPGIMTMAARPNGDLLVGGRLQGDSVVRWNGSVWTGLGAANGDVKAMVVLPSGDVVAAGQFTSIGGVSASRIAKWDGTTWHPLGAGLDGVVNSLVVAPSGDLIVGGSFTTAGGATASNVARFDGVTWTACGAFPPGLPTGFTVRSVAVEASGTLACGVFLGAGAGAVMRLEGANWAQHGSTLASNSGPSILALPNGDIAVTGVTPSALSGVSGAARLTSSDVWAPFPGGSYFNPYGRGIAWTSDGDIALVWDRGVTVVETACPAVSTTFAAGCPSSGGNNLLTAATLPWVEGTFRAKATGLPTFSSVLTVTGLTRFVPGFPLSAVFFESPVGCDLSVSLDILSALVTTDGTAELQLSLPNSPPLVGVTFYHQMVAFEPATAGGFAAITVTNGLALTAGTF